MNHVSRVNTFHQRLHSLMDSYVHSVYLVTKTFPKEELFGVTSQLRRSSLSVILNYIEGYARGSVLSNRNFLKISYGSLQESKYLIEFSFKEGFLDDTDFKKLSVLAEEIGAMLYATIRKKTE